MKTQKICLNLPSDAMETGETIKKLMLAAPVPWPMSVTEPGFPPNSSMLSLIHWRAAIWSRSPKLLTVCSLNPGLRNPENHLIIILYITSLH